MQSKILAYMTRYNFRKLVFCNDNDSGLKAIIAIHDTTLGPATGGCRMWTYASEEDAIMDALRLARGMTYKYAAAGVNLGGGKVVVIGDPRKDKSEALFRALGRFIDSLAGEYLTGEDVGITLEDLEYVRMETPHVVTLPEHAGGAGPISPSTAFGVLQAMRACLKEVNGDESLAGRSVALQGLGAVGAEVLPLLLKEGARVVVTDIDENKVRLARDEFNVDSVAPDEIHQQECDVFCPCALGAVINDETLNQLSCRIVCGSANNQLAEERHGDALQRRGILYAPDYIANAGGTIFDTDRLREGGFNRERARSNVARIYQTMERLIAISKREHIPTSQAADRLAEARLETMRKVRLI